MARASIGRLGRRPALPVAQAAGEPPGRFERGPHPREAAEYRDYIAYLQHRQYLGPEVEKLELDDLQGVQGLRALRVSVELENPRLQVPVSFEALRADR